MGCLFSRYVDKDNKVNYNDIKDQLKTGDFILFSGNAIESKLIQFATISPWSHIGIIIRLENEDKIKPEHKDPNNLYLWHSTADIIKSAKDGISNKAKGGVQFNALEKTLKMYKGRKALRIISFGLRCDDSFIEFMKQNSSKDYEINDEELLSSTFLGNKKKNINNYFCSELSAETYQYWGLLDDTIPSNNFIPEVFSSHHMKKFQREIKISKEMEIIMEDVNKVK